MIVLIIKFTASLLGGLMHYPIINNYKHLKISTVNIFFYSLFVRWFLLVTWFFFLDGHASGDVKSYELHNQWVLNGSIPNKDFVSPYGFYFYYLLSLPYKFFPHPISIIFVLHLCEFLGVLLFFIGIKKLSSIQISKLFLMIYFFNPLIITWFAFDGQDESLLILGFGGLFYATVHSSKLFKAFFSGFCIFVAKITGVAAVLPLFIKINNKEKFILILIFFFF